MSLSRLPSSTSRVNPSTAIKLELTGQCLVPERS
jgi:hypothetical protein